MSKTLFRGLALCACLLPAGAVAPVWAEPAGPFQHYQGWRDEPVQDWRPANDRVGQIGGWRTYLREAQPDAGGSRDQGAPQPSAPGGHGHHDHHHPGH
ncbi:MAG: hypothetical protein ACK4UX_00305 [Thiobacillus sp.]